MKKITTILSILLFVVTVSSCKNEKSLQGYLVNTSGKEGFYTGDLSVMSMLSAKAGLSISEDTKETMKSIKKINVAFLKKTTDNDAAYETEKAKLKKIFTDNDNYITLISMRAKGMNIKIYYSGDTESIDEVIAFGYGKKQGVGVARLLGDNMNPAKIIEMLNSVYVNIEGDNPLFTLFRAFFFKNVQS